MRALEFGTSDKEQIWKHWQIAKIFCKNDKVKSVGNVRETNDRE